MAPSVCVVVSSGSASCCFYFFDVFSFCIIPNITCPPPLSHHCPLICSSFSCPHPTFFSPLRLHCNMAHHHPLFYSFQLISCLENAPFLTPPSIPLHPSHVAGGEDGEARERDEIRHDRRKERQHDRNISRAAPDKRCRTRTLNTLHVNSPTPLPSIHTHRCIAHCWIIHGAASNTEQTQQDPADCSGVVLVSSEPQSVDACEMYVCVFVCVHCQVISWGNCGSLGEWKSWNSEQSSLQSQFQLPNLVILKLTFTSLWGCCLLKDSHQELHGKKSVSLVITDTHFTRNENFSVTTWEVFGDLTDSRSYLVLYSGAKQRLIRILSTSIGRHDEFSPYLHVVSQFWCCSSK